MEFLDTSQSLPNMIHRQPGNRKKLHLQSKSKNKTSILTHFSFKPKLKHVIATFIIKFYKVNERWLNIEPYPNALGDNIQS